MNILALGATGRVGSHVAKLAIQDGHRVTSLVRSPGKTLNPSQRLNVIHGDVLNRKDVLKVTTTLSNSISLIIEAMIWHGIRRIVTVGTAGILNSRQSLGLLRYQSSESKHRSTRATEEHHRAYHLLNRSDLDWTIVCPTYLAAGEYTGSYRTECNFLPENGVAISIPDTAEFTYHQITDDKYVRSRVGIAPFYISRKKN